MKVRFALILGLLLHVGAIQAMGLMGLPAGWDHDNYDKSEEEVDAQAPWLVFFDKVGRPIVVSVLTTVALDSMINAVDISAVSDLIDPNIAQGNINLNSLRARRAVHQSTLSVCKKDSDDGNQTSKSVEGASLTKKYTLPVLPKNIFPKKSNFSSHQRNVWRQPIKQQRPVRVSIKKNGHPAGHTNSYSKLIAQWNKK